MHYTNRADWRNFTLSLSEGEGQGEGFVLSLGFMGPTRAKISAETSHGPPKDAGRTKTAVSIFVLLKSLGGSLGRVMVSMRDAGGVKFPRQR